MQTTAAARKRGAARTLFVNLLVFFVLFNLAYWAIPTVSGLARVLNTWRAVAASMPPETSTLDTLRETVARWSSIGLPPAEYRAHVGWRRVATTNESVTVEGPYGQRRTINTAGADKPKVYFFGGSTMWGTGVADGETIPSAFAAKTGWRTENFGEPGYTAHQSLLLLIELLQAGHRPDLVVFYDGVNDTWIKCRAELTPTSHEREQQFRTTLRRSTAADSFSHYFAPMVTAASNIHREINREARGIPFDCHRDPQKAQAIADNMMKDWEFARQLVEWHGGKFVAFLQPVAQFSRSPLHLAENHALIERLRPQYDAVYPLLRERVARASGNIHNVENVVDGETPVFIDFCHLNGPGNAKVAEKIAELVGPLGVGR